MRLFKLTEKNYYTQNGTLWGPNVTHSVTIPGTTLCSNQVIHAYEDPRLAIIMNPAHANFYYPLLWEAKGDIVISDGTRCGVKTLTTISKIPIPNISNTTKVAFGIYCALEVFKNLKFETWALAWLDGSDRSGGAAANAAYYAYYAAAKAAKAANDAYYAAAKAANAAANAAKAANAAANAANAAAKAKINFINLIDKAELVK